MSPLSNPSKQKGTKWETECVELVRRVYAKAIRSPAWGAEDRGDLHDTGPFTIECKAVKSFNLSQFVEEAKVEAKNAGKRFGVVFLKRPRKSTAQGYAIMEIGDFIDLMEIVEGEPIVKD